MITQGLDQAIYAVLRDIRDMMARPVLKVIKFIPSKTLTLTTSAQSVYRAYSDFAPYGYVQSLTIKVQNMGTATKVNIGDSSAQLGTLTYVGDFTTLTAPKGYYIDIKDIFISADVGTTSIVELSGLYYPQNSVSPPVQPMK
jgi:hypothetical protein